jgi:hypothetical protein
MAFQRTGVMQFPFLRRFSSDIVSNPAFEMASECQCQVFSACTVWCQSPRKRLFYRLVSKLQTRFFFIFSVITATETLNFSPGDLFFNSRLAFEMLWSGT